jgi:hypothetical protein
VGSPNEIVAHDLTCGELEEAALMGVIAEDDCSRFQSLASENCDCTSSAKMNLAWTGLSLVGVVMAMFFC